MSEEGQSWPSLTLALPHTSLSKMIMISSSLEPTLQVRRQAVAVHDERGQLPMHVAHTLHGGPVVDIPQQAQALGGAVPVLHEQQVERHLQQYRGSTAAGGTNCLAVGKRA